MQGRKEQHLASHLLTNGVSRLKNTKTKPRERKFSEHAHARETH